MIIGTAGHIDHGKTLLVKALTGVSTDRLKEEKARGISIELGFAYVPVPDSPTTRRPSGAVLGFVDVPGHEKLVRTMVAGAASIDFALLVVAADDGVMPQTLEHLQVLDLLGIAEGIVALNKVDLVDAERRLEVEEQIRQLLVGTSLDGIDILPVSAAQGIGVSDLKQRLLEEAASRPEQYSRGTFRLAIDRCFTLQGAGTIVTGAVRSGRISVGDKVLVMPAGQEVRVRTLHAQGKEATTGYAGERCALNLVGIKRSSLKRGDWLVDPGIAALTDRFDAEMRLLETEKRAIQTWCPIHLHVGTSRVSARIVMLEGRELRPGEKTLVQLITDRALPLVFGDQFIIRDVSAGRSMGGGHVVDPAASRRGRRTAARQAFRAALRLSDPAEALDGLLWVAPGIVDLDGFVVGRGLSKQELEEILDLLEPKISKVSGRTFVTYAETIDEIGDAVSQKLAEFHAEYPDLPGMPEATLRSFFKPRLPGPTFDAAIAILASEGVLVVVSNTLRLPSHLSRFRAAEQVLWERITAVMETRRHQPPPLRELAEALSQPVTQVRKVCKTMVRMGVLVEVTKDRFFLRTALAELAELVHDIANSSVPKGFTVGEFRDRAGCGRAIAVQVLEYFDRRGITGRRGDTRIVSRTPIDVFRNVPMS
ncbi:MAG: selenocysteine-specific translation elongation factor [Hyphomicrobiaceae bacterium]